MNNKHFSHFDLAGFTYYDGVIVFNKLKIGSPLHLATEPTNPHDPYAVEIYYSGMKLGYVPRGHNQTISQFLRLGYTELFEAFINRITPEGQNWGSCTNKRKRIVYYELFELVFSMNRKIEETEILICRCYSDEHQIVVF